MEDSAVAPAVAVTSESKQLKAEKEANKMIHRYNRAWKRLRPEIDLPSSDYKTKPSLNLDDPQSSSSALPSLQAGSKQQQRPVT